jgi:hypothetical protein
LTAPVPRGSARLPPTDASLGTPTKGWSSGGDRARRGDGWPGAPTRGLIARRRISPRWLDAWSTSLPARSVADPGGEPARYPRRICGERDDYRRDVIGIRGQARGGGGAGCVAGDARSAPSGGSAVSAGRLEAGRPAPGEDEARSSASGRAAPSGRSPPPRAPRRRLRGTAVAERIAAALKELEPLAKIDPTLGPGVERLREAGAAVEDVARDLGRYARGIRSDPARLLEVEERLHLLQRLSRKHGATLAELAARREALAAELGALGSYEEGLTGRQRALDEASLQARTAAEALTRARRQAATSLERKVIAALRELGFSSPRLIVEIEAKELGPAAPTDPLPVEPNPGDPPRPLAKIASG